MSEAGRLFFRFALRATLAVAIAVGLWAAGIPAEFVLFALTLAGVALLHRHNLQVALTGLAVLTLYKLGFAEFKSGPGFGGLVQHLAHEWVILANLFALLLGFALLARQFEESRLPLVLPRILPDDWRGGFMLLVMIFVLSSFLDNIAAALIGGSIAGTVFRGRVHIGYLAAIVAASNAGGAGSVVGDTTTTMMWLDGVDPREVLEAFLASGTAVVIFGIPASLQQHRHSPITADAPVGVSIDWARVAIVAMMLVAAIVANVSANLVFPALADAFPLLGASVWAVILLTAGWRRPAWESLPEALKGSIFLLSLILCASYMPVETLPPAGWDTAFGLGFVSAVFDNIPLTALALKQGGYDWGFLAFAVGFGGSMIWFGSSAGVALASVYPQARSVGLWIRHGWPIVVAYVAGFFVLLAVQGWHPHAPHKRGAAPVVQQAVQQAQGTSQ